MCWPPVCSRSCARFDFGETRVARFDDEEKSVVRRAFETFPVKHRMIPARQPVHDQQGEESRESGEENRQLKHDREKRRHRRKS